MNRSGLKSRLRRLRFVVPAFLFTTTLFLVYLCIKHCFLGLFDLGYKITALFLWAVFSFIFVLWIVAFFVLVCGDPGSMVHEIRHSQRIPHCTRRCPKCDTIKPPRVYHCFRCDRCHIRMDHHCDALGVCIALRNTKVFIMYLLYSIGLLSIYGGSSTLLIFTADVSYVYYIEAIFGISLVFILMFLLGSQLIRVINGHAYVELAFGNEFTDSRSRWDHWVDIFGPPSLLWVLPVRLSPGATSTFKLEKLE